MLRSSQDHAPNTGFALDDSGHCELCGEPIDAEELSVEAFEITGFLTCTSCLEAMAEQEIAA